MSYDLISSKIYKNKLLILILLTALLFYLNIYYIWPSRPGVNVFVYGENEQKGWLNWADQSRFYEISDALIKGNFNPSIFVYSIGYPVISIPFTWLKFGGTFDHRFLIPNIMMFLTIIFGLYKLSLKTTDRKEFAIISVILLLFVTNYTFSFQEPQTTHVTSFGSIILLFLLFNKLEKIDKRTIIFVSLTLGWIFATRFQDVLFFIPLVSVFIIYRPKKIVWMFPLLIIILIILGLNTIIFSDPLHIPDNFKMDQWDDPKLKPLWEKTGKFSTDPIVLLHRSYCILIEPKACLIAPTGSEVADTGNHYDLIDKTPILLSSTIFFIFAPYGLFILLKKYHGYERFVIVGLVISFLLYMFAYLSTFLFHSGWTRFWRFEEVWFPLATLFSTIGITNIYQTIKSHL